MKNPIFLDNQSTTPLDPDVLQAMMPFLTEQFGNASSRTHSYGWEAREGVELARARVAKAIGSETNEVIFTSGATESLNLAILGLARRMKNAGHIITSNVEHPASLAACREAERLGARVTSLACDRHGTIHADQVRDALEKDTFLVNLIFANNEVGTLNPVAEIGKVCAEAGVIFHTDASQALGKVAIDVKPMGIGMMSLSAHKIYGPKGVGALHVSRQNPRVRLGPLMPGGGQENGLRGGTQNVAGIVGFGAACEIARQKRITDVTHVMELRQLFMARLQADLGEEVKLNGHPLDRLPHNLSLTFRGAPSRSVLAQIHTRVALSTGSSCSSESGEMSHVLKALGLNDEEGRCTLRIGFGRFNLASQAEFAAQLLADAVKKARRQDSPRISPEGNEALSG
jgi:cysteine desulfurase